MFYNCNNVKEITFNMNYNILYPNDLTETFYNCTNLISLYFNYFRTDYVQNLIIIFIII